MFKKLASLFLVAALIVTMFAVASCSKDEGINDSTGENFRVGVILIGDETEGYTKAHMDGIKTAAEELGLTDDQIIWEYVVGENNTCYEKAKELALKGCQLIISNSYGHQDFMIQAAKEYPDTTFISMTGDFAAIGGAENFHNAFTKVYESRYVSGVVAGMKIKELVENGTISPETTPEHYKDGKVKVGYVGAFAYAEVVSGYTAFYLGIKSVYPDVTMDVTYTLSWFDFDKEGAAAEAFIADGCVIIGQHADSQGAPKAVQKALEEGKVCYSVGYNVDMLDVAPNGALTSATNNWAVYYEYAIGAAMNGEEIATDWAEGYSEGAVAITELGVSCAEGTAEKVAEIEAALKDGSLKVFDTSTFTVGGEEITADSDEAKVDLSYMDFSGDTPQVIYEGETVDAVKTENGITFFDESSFRSAPYFTVRIDGIIEK